MYQPETKNLHQNCWMLSQQWIQDQLTIMLTLFIPFKNFSNMLQRVKKRTIQRIKCTVIYLLNQVTWQAVYVKSDVTAKFNTTFQRIFYYYHHCYYFIVSCQRPFLPGTFLLEITVIPTSKTSSFRLQYFQHYVRCSKHSCLLE